MRTGAIPSEVSNRLTELLNDARTSGAAGDHDMAWQVLEDAHILSQPWVRPHVRVHVAMLALGWKTRDRPEILGQMFRLAVAAPGSLLGRYPTGNTGRANVSAFQAMPIRDDLAALLGRPPS